MKILDDRSQRMMIAWALCFYENEVTGIKKIMQAVVEYLAAAGSHIWENEEGIVLIDEVPEFRYDLLREMGRKLDELGE